VPDNVTEMAKTALKKSGKLTYDPAAYAAGYLEGIKVAKEIVVKAFEKFVEKGPKS
jgi:hypothetical protein